MAEECVSVQFSDGDVWEYCWEDVTPYTGWDASSVRTGLRPGNVVESEGDGGEGEEEESSDPTLGRGWRSCQFYLKGMPAICKHWKAGAPGDDAGSPTEGEYHCSYMTENTSDNPLNPSPVEPTGYNFGQCDFLGRRSWCNSYEAAGTYNPDQWICCAPNPYLTGFGKPIMGNKSLLRTAIPRSEITGYNDAEDGTGTGLCDCHGWGRGSKGCEAGGTPETMTLNDQKTLMAMPIRCQYYRPFQMGFGIIEPYKKQPGDLEEDKQTITDQGWRNTKEWEESYEYYRLPLNYELYNIRSKVQKCQWWEEDSGRNYVMIDGFIELQGGDDNFNTETGRVLHCTCENSDAAPFNTRAWDTWEEGEDDPEGTQIGLYLVWANGGGPVCNGARPECPCYTGKWKYLTQERMMPGMPVTAPQVLELRFYTSQWDNQEDYDDYYNIRPNFDDPPAPEIFTFTKWVKEDSDEAQAAVDIKRHRMAGKRIWLCQPAPIHNKEFSKEYIEYEDIEYRHIEIGTSSPDQRHYPTLVRLPNYEIPIPLNVVYPPYNNDYFTEEVCQARGEPGYTKRSSNIYGDQIRVIGQTLGNRRVYVINTNEIYVSDLLGFFPGIFAIKSSNILERSQSSIKEEIYNVLREAVSRGFKEAPDYISRTIADDRFGFFMAPPIKLDYTRNPNLILIAVDLGDGTWEYRWREVNNIWYGGVAKQISYENEYPETPTGWSNPVPQEIAPGGDARAVVSPLGGSRGGSAEVVSTFSLDNIWAGYTMYDYAYERVEVEEEYQEHWGAVGNSDKILLEFVNKNINYVYDWEIWSAKLVWIPPEEEVAEGEEPPSPPGGLPEEVELESLIEDDSYIGAAMAVLQPKNSDHRMHFFNSDWELYVTYAFVQLTNSPSGYPVIHGGGKSDLHIMVNSPHSVSGGSDFVDIEGITAGTPGFMVHFKDENERIICAFASKMLVNIVSERCRGVDIEYRYSAMGRQYKLMPESGFCIDIAQDHPMVEPYKHVEIPNCGDHEHSWQKWEGPMWFPYNVCRGYDMYDEFTVCNNCQAGYVGPDNAGVNTEGGLAGGMVIKRHDYRYCGPYKYDAFADTRGNWAAACDCGCRFWYSDASTATVLFEGRSYIKGPVDLREYAEQGWYPPPYGNEGREIVEKYLSQDYVTHLIPFIVDGQIQRADWMPLMLDHSSFFATFNAYDDNPEDEFYVHPSPGFEPFRYVHQLTMALNVAIGEEMKEDPPSEDAEPGDIGGRYNWDELFDVHHEGNCSYPLPTYPIGSLATKAVFYYLKLDWAAWAWQEAWKDIERSSADDLPETEPEEGEEDTEVITEVGLLEFVDIKRPKYLWSYYKEEHRRIIDEGEYTIIYEGPQFTEGQLSKYPTLSIDGAFPRPFEILYGEDSYTSDNTINWVNEGGDADTQAGQGEDNIYEEANGSDWAHEDNLIFSADAVTSKEAAKDAGRRIISGKEEGTGIGEGYIYKYYNRGLIMEITRDRLYYLPKETEERIIDVDSAIVVPEQMEDSNAQLVPGSYVWSSSSVSLTIQFEEAISLAAVQIAGPWGESPGLNDSEFPRPTTNTVVKPGVSVSCNFSDGSEGTPRGMATSAATPIFPLEGQELENYLVYMDFLLGPYEMVNKQVNTLTITLTGQEGSFISVDSISILTARYVDVKYEHIKVHERKYIASQFTSIGNLGINLDGPGDHLHYNEDMLNMGQYFSYRGARFKDKEVIAVDKTKVVSCGIHHPNDERAEGLTYDTLHEYEATAQKDIYEYAYNLDPTSDVTVYSAVEPFKYKEFLSNIGEVFPSSWLRIEAHKLPWKDHYRTKAFKQYDFWRPGGHYYTWDKNFRKEKCMLFGPPESVFPGRYIHVDHTGIGTPLEADASKPIDPGNSYYSLRFYTQQAKYDRAMILAGGSPEYTDKWGLGGSASAGTF